VSLHRDGTAENDKGLCCTETPECPTPLTEDDLSPAPSSPLSCAPCLPLPGALSATSAAGPPRPAEPPAAPAVGPPKAGGPPADDGPFGYLKWVADEVVLSREVLRNSYIVGFYLNKGSEHRGYGLANSIIVTALHDGCYDLMSNRKPQT
jgi:hypothetical protein